MNDLAAAAAAAVSGKSIEVDDNSEQPCCCCRVEIYPSRRASMTTTTTTKTVPTDFEFEFESNQFSVQSYQSSHLNIITILYITSSSSEKGVRTKTDRTKGNIDTGIEVDEWAEEFIVKTVEEKEQLKR